MFLIVLSVAAGGVAAVGASPMAAGTMGDDGIDVDVGSTSNASSDEDDLDLDIPPE